MVLIYALLTVTFAALTKAKSGVDGLSYCVYYEVQKPSLSVKASEIGKMIPLCGVEKLIEYPLVADLKVLGPSNGLYHRLTMFCCENKEKQGNRKLSFDIQGDFLAYHRLMHL